MTALQVGQPAPNFTLPNEKREPVHLQDLRGQVVVLFFYPLDFSGVCTGELCEIRDRFFPDITTNGATFFGISRDSTHSHRVFIEREGLQHSLLADMKGEVAQLYGTWNEDAGFAERLTVVIDKAGIIRFLDKSPAIATARDQQKMVDAIQALAA